MTTTVLALSELSCQHCVKSVTKALQAIDGVQSADVTLERATVVGEVDPQVLIHAVQEAGYQAVLASEAK
ncbi:MULTISPECIES: cation transporter [Pasteurellaceae]|uniref:cation transporter n=1 Tax=Pasteurellaceae TaxID=712 RepID=UPI000509EB96